ncbi:CsbD family protein [Litoreibacter roseus]|uniref:CsbD family protein n=1 Tax=Litoreibacter roseus TaxID=2601869 RepID=A0A6N6JDC0_9RHOB|nr:CsbD family protein [Litoreibacter roseus]GFE63369.1 CsbD family protein [Litoreibacter roseus]
MNWDQVQGNWKEWKGKAQSKWGELTNDELDQAEGDREQLEGLIQQKYGKTKEQARAEVDSWMSGS